MKREHLITLTIIFALVAIVLALSVLKTSKNKKPADEINLSEEKTEANPFQTEIIVHISGCVKNPGVYKMKSNLRLLDLIKLAGGPVNADLDRLNLAKNLEDGEKIFLPAKSEATKFSGNYAPGIQIPENQKVNLNTASASELETLPGIGPELAQKIVAYRQKNGYFSSINDLRKVGGIGVKKIEKIKEKASCY